MTIRIAVNHRTGYRFDRTVGLYPHLVRLRPAPHCRTPILSYSLRVEPHEHFVNWQQDPFGNWVARYVFPEPARALTFEVDLVADMTVINPFDFFLEEEARGYPLEYPAPLARDLAPYLEHDGASPVLDEWLAAVDRREQDIVDFIVGLNQRVQRDVGYVIRMEPGVQSPGDTLERARGSCRDSGWLLVQIFRRLGLAARFVSGYLVQLAPDVESLDGPSGPTEDFTDLHAWAEVFVPGAGWLGLDATSGLFAGEGHIPLACTPDPRSAAPVLGHTDRCESELDYTNRVTRIHEDPRVTRPYTDRQWAAIDRLGDTVDRMLEASDVRLTMGGEPTFVSIDDMDGAEWNTAALGEDKRRLAGTLFERLRERRGPGTLPHHGQGKWYPGEALPRWALSCFWRTDGEPLWRDPALLAAERDDLSHDGSDARRLAEHIAAGLGLPRERLVTGYEDVFHYLWREGSLPENVDPLDSRLEDPLERARLARLFDGALGEPVGYALPVRPNPLPDAGPRWQTSRWRFTRKHMFLVPGDSPMGLRLPLGSLPWTDPDARESEPARDPFEPRGALPPPSPAPRAPGSATADAPDGHVVHTALCVEARGGRVHVFLPPVERLEALIDLLHAVESAAERVSIPVVLEGYEPPRDPRIQVLQVTPDPGVIEVNVHPASSWRELVDTTTTLYDDARLARLGTEKFQLDGRHTGTGGGNHVTLGGRSPADSPFLRRPSLLASLITYWQLHPALSYLFSGTFIGPTSQAPRVDEARDDNLHELEIALSRLPGGDEPKPWLVDRILRNLLVDLTGNTHRAEFCIDKLYSPDGPAGRRGLVELRAFEMPPHARMSLVQVLLLRALVARFWDHPLSSGLARWGTDLHDRFMLEHFVTEDIARVVSDLRAWGFEFEAAWFAPFLEFRFPRYGSTSIDGVEIEIRGALEPWHVLGEEMSAGGTARYVDSSVERVQVKVRGFVPGRQALACNRRAVPLRPTGVSGEFVAGVRFKAWDPPSALHPGIGVHAPLVFDLYDRHAERALGGCTYHVGHPAGRNYETFPVNANEAEARRAARFWAHGHTPGDLRVDESPPSPDFPATLDLRYGGPASEAGS